MLMSRFLQLLLLLIGCTTQGCISDDEPQGTALQPGDSLPSFSLTLSNGEEVSTRTLEGKVPVIVFFNTECPDCRKELPIVEEAWQEWQDNNLVVFMAVSREENEESVAKYWEEHKLTIPYSAQTGREIYSLFAPGVIPRIFIADKEGVITFTSDDTDMPDVETLSEAISRSLHGSPNYEPR